MEEPRPVTSVSESSRGGRPGCSTFVSTSGGRDELKGLKIKYQGKQSENGGVLLLGGGSYCDPRGSKRVKSGLGGGGSCTRVLNLNKKKSDATRGDE